MATAHPDEPVVHEIAVLGDFEQRDVLPPVATREVLQRVEQRRTGQAVGVLAGDQAGRRVDSMPQRVSWVERTGDFVVCTGHTDHSARGTRFRLVEPAGQVEPWLARCRRAADDPSYDLADDVELPVPLPAWIVVEDYPRNYLGALAHAAAEVGAHAAVALGAVLAAGRPPEGQATRLTTAQGMVATADSAVASVLPLLQSSEGGGELHELVASRLQDALQQYFEAGQRLRMDAREPARTRSAGPGRAGPGRAGEAARSR